jgi:hypothetical protein
MYQFYYTTRPYATDEVYEKNHCDTIQLDSVTAMRRMVTPSPEPRPTMPPLLVRKTLLRRSFQARYPAGPGLRPANLPLLDATRCLACCDPSSSCVVTVTARGYLFGEPPLSLLEIVTEAANEAVAEAATPEQLPGPSDAGARKSGLKLAVMLDGDADGQPPSRHVSDSVSVRALLHKSMDTRGAVRGSRRAGGIGRRVRGTRTENPTQTRGLATSATLAPQARARAPCSDPPAHEPLSPPRILTSTPRANLPRIPAIFGTNTAPN